jgi:hypothetical protein
LGKHKEFEMKTKVPGLGDSTGVKPIDFTLPPTKAGELYTFEIGSVTSKLSVNSPCLVNTFSMVVIDGPDDPKSGKTTQGRKFTHRINVLLPEHDKYDPTNTRNADELADLCTAAGVDFDNDGYDPEDFAGKNVKAALGVKMGKDQDGAERPENVIRQVKDNEGHVHLWLSDDGKPSTKKGGPKASASAGRRR